MLEEGMMIEENPTTVSVQAAPETDASVTDLADQVTALLDYANERTVESYADVKAATEDLSIIAGLRKALAAKQKEYTSPLDALKKSILSSFQRVTAPLEQANQVTRNKVLAYQAEQKRIADEKAAILRQEQELAERKARLNGTPVPPAGKMTIPEPPTTSHGELGTSSQRKIAKWRLVDFAQVPDKYKTLNEALVGKLVRAGERDIPGIEVYEETILAVTSAVNREEPNDSNG